MLEGTHTTLEVAGLRSASTPFAAGHDVVLELAVHVAVGMDIGRCADGFVARVVPGAVDQAVAGLGLRSLRLSLDGRGRHEDDREEEEELQEGLFVKVSDEDLDVLL
jgi:hypothetical protein